MVPVALICFGIMINGIMTGQTWWMVAAAGLACFVTVLARA
jgi:hypothetical protein